MSKSLYVSIPDELYEKFDRYCFENKVTKKQIMQLAINGFILSNDRTPRAKSTQEILTQPVKYTVAEDVLKREPYQE